MERDLESLGQIAKTLAGHFDSLYYVDIETDQFFEFSSKGLYRELDIETEGEDFFRLTQKNAEHCVHPDDLELRSQLMWTSTIGHNGLLDVGRNGGDWACHFIEHEISARLPIVHGEGMAMITPAWMRFVSKRPECRDRMKQFASRVWGAEFPEDEDYGIELAIERQVNWYKLLGLRSSLKNVDGFTEDMAKEISDSFGWKPGQFVTLDRDSIFEILRNAMK